MRLHADALEARDTPAALASAGGVVYELSDTASVVRSFRPFEDAAAGVPVHLAADGGRIWVGAGFGGGPRLQVRDAATLVVLADVFLGDPASRTGVSVAAIPGAAPAARGPLRAEPDPEFPGAPAAVDAILSGVPLSVQSLLASAGQRVYVYGGTAVTQIPRFAALAGVLTPAGGDGPRTYDQIGAVYSYTGPLGPGAVVRSTETPLVVLHELGHAVEASVSQSDRGRWRAVHAAGSWPTEYESTNEQEAFAEGFRRWVQQIPQPSATVNGYFDAMFPGNV